LSEDSSTPTNFTSLNESCVSEEVLEEFREDGSSLKFADDSDVETDSEKRFDHRIINFKNFI